MIDRVASEAGLTDADASGYQMGNIKISRKPDSKNKTYQVTDA